jgi:DNA-binding MarR family transcriptional regulator
VSETVLAKLPRSAKEVYSIIINEGPLSSKEIVKKVSCSTRSVRYALKLLLDQEYVRKYPCLNDMRQTLYSITPHLPTATIERLKGELMVMMRLQ